MGDYGGGYNNYTTSYSAQGGAGGGGFMANSGSQDGGGGPPKDRGYGKDTLRPVTIKQLNDATKPHPDAEFQIDGQEVTQVIFVAQVRNISMQATNYTYRLDDGTGTIEVKKWIDPEANSDESGGQAGKPKISEDTYVRVWGRLKQFNDKRHVGAVLLRAVEDMNEVQYHLLEATAVHLYFTKGPLTGDEKQNGGNVKSETNGYGAQADMNGGSRQLPAGLSAGARKMYACLSNSTVTNEGLHMQELAVKAGMDTADVGKAADELLNHGMVYTTVDDQTWAILEDL